MFTTLLLYGATILILGGMLQMVRISKSTTSLAPWRQSLALVGLIANRAASVFVAALVAYVFSAGALRASWPFNVVDGIVTVVMVCGAVGAAFVLYVTGRLFSSGGFKLPPIVLGLPRWAQRFARR